MTDVLTKEQRRKNMQAIRSSDTSIEIKVSKDLWKKGFRIRKNCEKLFGRPDISMKKYRIVIFIDSCFWHGCQQHGHIPKSNEAYWIKKLCKNSLRDQEVNDYYQTSHWTVLRIWEHEVKYKYDETIDKIVSLIEYSKLIHEYNRFKHKNII